jgi:hypothetical protein
VDEPAVDSVKALDYAKYDMVRALNQVLDVTGLRESLLERLFARAIAVPAGRFLRMKRAVNLRVPRERRPRRDRRRPLPEPDPRAVAPRRRARARNRSHGHPLRSKSFGGQSRHELSRRSRSSQEHPIVKKRPQLLYELCVLYARS